MTLDLAILGTGTVARDIALWALQCGLQVRVLGRRPEALATLPQDLAARLARVAPDTRTDALRVAPLGTPGSLAGATHILEAIPEDPALKAELWARILSDPEATGAPLSATSSLALHQYAPDHPRSGELCTFHPFVPMHRARLVEVAAGPASRREEALALAAALRLEVVEVADGPGLAGSRMSLAMGLEAMRLLESGAATVTGLDTLMTRGYGHALGPLEVSDRVGLDVRLAIAETLHARTGDPVFQPPAILRRLVAAGRLGRKSGAGFYQWPTRESLDGSPENLPSRGPALRDPLAGL